MDKAQAKADAGNAPKADAGDAPKTDAGDSPKTDAEEDRRPESAAKIVERKAFANGRVQGDRRKNLRYDVDDSAAIHLVRVGSILRGRILDLSVSGCRIRTNDRFLVGIYTFVEIEFRHRGMPLRLAGVIQAIHDRNTVGIRFLDVSQRKRRQLEDLIEDIREIAELRAVQAPS